MSENVSTEFRATSDAQVDAWRAGRVAAPEEIREGLWMLALPITEGTLASSFGYAILGHDGVHIIDPGWAADEVLESWREFLADRGQNFTDVRTIVVTHSHPDHLGIAGRLRELSGAELLMSAAESAVLNDDVAGADETGSWILAELETWGVPDQVRDELRRELDAVNFAKPILPDRVVADGDELQLAGRTLRVHATPGHTDGHICLEDAAAELLFTGDHVLPQIYPGIGLGRLPGSEPLGAYLRSLRELSDLDHCEILPGHEYRFRGLRTRCEKITAHHLRRTAAVREVYRRVGDASVWVVAGLLRWTRGWDNLVGFERQSAMRQTELHLTVVRSGVADEWLGARGFSHAE